MTPAEEKLKADRLAEDRHIAVMAKLGDIEKMVAAAVGTVISIADPDPEAVAERVEKVLKEITD